jgi:predicted house-cleaning noncanonical NTP pyrophosphatase (MazG superfamily)
MLRSIMIMSITYDQNNKGATRNDYQNEVKSKLLNPIKGMLIKINLREKKLTMIIYIGIIELFGNSGYIIYRYDNQEKFYKYTKFHLTY